MVRSGWTKKMFIIGAVLDSGYRFAMTFGAALMIGWTALLVNADMQASVDKPKVHK